MSTGLNREILQVTPDKWYYIIEDYNAPKNSWDWREYAGAYGPFPTEMAAREHLDRFQANPGGYSVEALGANVDRLHYEEPGHKDYDKVLVQLISEAPKHTRRV